MNDALSLVGNKLSDRWEIERLIYESGISYIYQGRDLLSNRIVAIKVFKKENIHDWAENFARFRRDLSVLSTFKHPSLAEILQITEKDELSFIVMEWIDGISLDKGITERLRYGVHDKINIIKQVAELLSFVHGKGIAHKELIPANIIVQRSAGDYRIKVINFGMAQLSEASVISDSEVSPMLRYMSPEQTGIIGKPVDERSDLYSLGMIAYAFFTGGPAFKGNDVRTLLHHQIAKRPVPPRTLDKDMPEVIERIVLKLLSKDPEERYQTASGLVDDLSRWQRGEVDFLIGRNDRFNKLNFRTRMIGRDAELIELKKLYMMTAAGSGGMCFINGEAGEGKSRLVDELREYIYDNNGEMLYGQCGEKTHKSPYQPYMEVVDDYLNRLERYSTDEKVSAISRMNQSAGELGGIIVNWNPALRKYVTKASAPAVLDPEMENRRFLMVASRFLHDVGTKQRPVVIVLDNIQWADGGTLTLLKELIPLSSVSYVLWLVLCRDDEVKKGSSLFNMMNDIRGKDSVVHEIKLHNLSLTSICHMISELMLEDEMKMRDLCEYVYRRSKGNPFFAFEIIRQLVNEKAIVYSNSGWTVDWDKLKDTDVSPTLLDILDKRVNLLDAEMIDILSKAAVMGKSFDISYIFSLSDLPGEKVLDIVDRCIDMHLLFRGAGKGEISFIHEKVRKVFYEKLSDEDKKKFHFMVASAMERSGQEGVERSLFALADHYAEAGDAEKTLQYALPAAEKAMKGYANDDAVKYFKVAIGIYEEKGNVGNAESIRAMDGLASVYLTMGLNDEAISITGRTIPFKSSKLEKAAAFRLIGSAYFKKGSFEECEKNLTTGLALLGESFPLARNAVLLRTAREIIGLASRYLLNTIFRLKKKGISEKDREIIQLYYRLFWMYALSDVGKFIYTVFRYSHIAASRIGISKELALTYCADGVALMAMPMFKWSIYFYEKALEIQMAVNNIQGVAQTLQYMGYSYTWSGDRVRSAAAFSQSKENFINIGDVWEVAQAANGIGFNNKYDGHYDKAIEAFSEYLSISEKTGNSLGMSSAQTAIALCFAEKGDIDLARLNANSAAAISRSGKLWFYFCFALIGLGTIELESGNYDEAMDYFRDARTLYEDNNFLKDYTVNIYSLLAEAEIAKMNAGTAKVDIAWERATEKICAKALNSTRRWPNHYASALRANAKLHYISGRKKKAESMFKNAIGQATRYGLRYELAKGHFEYGNFLRSVNRGVEGQSQLEKAYGIFKDIGARKYIDRVEKALRLRQEVPEKTQEKLTKRLELSSIMNFTRTLSSILDLKALLEKIMDISIEIAGAQRGFLFLYPEEFAAEKKLELMVNRGIDADGYKGAEFEMCGPVLKRVEKDGEAVIIADAAQEKWMKDDISVKKYGLRSILCSPLMVRDKMIGIVYLDNCLLGGVFNEDKVEVLKILLAQAAISIENARATGSLKSMQAALKDYASTLEGKVKERTAELEKMLNKVEEANHNKTQFVSDVSHELRTPLASIKGYVSTIRSDKQMEQATREEFLGIVEDETDRLARIIDQLLDISRIEAGRIKLNLRSFPIADAIHKNIENLRELAKKKEVNLIEDIKGELPLVYADQDKTAQIIINLLSNAVKYNKKGGSVRVSAEDSGDKVRVLVEDTGFGIAENDLPHMFEKFYRVERTSDQAPGTGLGLAVTKSLLEVMGGGISVESRIGEGSKFTFMLPKGATN